MFVCFYLDNLSLQDRRRVGNRFSLRLQNTGGIYILFLVLLQNSIMDWVELEAMVYIGNSL